jgi:hypothetical protein
MILQEYLGNLTFDKIDRENLTVSISFLVKSKLVLTKIPLIIEIKAIYPILHIIEYGK